MSLGDESLSTEYLVPTSTTQLVEEGRDGSADAPPNWVVAVAGIGTAVGIVLIVSLLALVIFKMRKCLGEGPFQRWPSTRRQSSRRRMVRNDSLGIDPALNSPTWSLNFAQEAIDNNSGENVDETVYDYPASVARPVSRTGFSNQESPYDYPPCSPVRVWNPRPSVPENDNYDYPSSNRIVNAGLSRPGNDTYDYPSRNPSPVCNAGLRNPGIYDYPPNNPIPLQNIHTSASDNPVYDYPSNNPVSVNSTLHPNSMAEADPEEGDDPIYANLPGSRTTKTNTEGRSNWRK